MLTFYLFIFILFYKEKTKQQQNEQQQQQQVRRRRLHADLFFRGGPICYIVYTCCTLPSVTEMESYGNKATTTTTTTKRNENHLKSCTFDIVNNILYIAEELVDLLRDLLMRVH
jgi:hypothetical protein